MAAASPPNPAPTMATLIEASGSILEIIVVAGRDFEIVVLKRTKLLTSILDSGVWLIMRARSLLYQFNLLCPSAGMPEPIPDLKIGICMANMDFGQDGCCSCGTASRETRGCKFRARISMLRCSKHLLKAPDKPKHLILK